MTMIGFLVCLVVLVALFHFAGKVIGIVLNVVFFLVLLGVCISFITQSAMPGGASRLPIIQGVSILDANGGGYAIIFRPKEIIAHAKDGLTALERAMSH